MVLTTKNKGLICVANDFLKSNETPNCTQFVETFPNWKSFFSVAPLLYSINLSVFMVTKVLSNGVNRREAKPE